MVSGDLETGNGNSKIDELYDNLLFDEEFQKLRAEALTSLSKDKQKMLDPSDRVYLSGKSPPNWIA